MKLRSLPGDSEPIEDLFGTKRSFAPFMRISWTPMQYYRYEGQQKIYERSSFPTFKLELSRSFLDILGSTSQYNRIEFDISQHIPFGLRHSLQYHLGTGSFINQKTEYFADFVYFSKYNFSENWNDGLGGNFNLLNRELYNASKILISSRTLPTRNASISASFTPLRSYRTRNWVTALATVFSTPVFSAPSIRISLKNWV